MSAFSDNQMSEALWQLKYESKTIDDCLHMYATTHSETLKDVLLTKADKHLKPFLVAQSRVLLLEASVQR